MTRTHLPKKEKPEERELRLLAEAMWILMNGSKPSPEPADVTEKADAINMALGARFHLEELRRAENWIKARVETYRYEADVSARSARMKDATATLLRIERACADLARAFDEASPDAYSVLDGHAPGGTNYRHLAWKPRGSGTARDFQTLLAITGRYLLPIGPGQGPEDRVTDMLSIGPMVLQTHRVASGGKLRTFPGEPVSWSEAAAALGMRIGMLREDFEERFHQEDVGGKQANYSEQVRGNPKWILARECAIVSHDFSKYWSENVLTGGKTGRFARLVLAIYEYAIDKEMLIKHQNKGKGEGLDGLDHYVRRVISILPRISELNQKRNNFSKKEYREWEQLQILWNTGREPKAAEPPKTPKSTKRGKAKNATQPEAT